MAAIREVNRCHTTTDLYGMICGVLNYVERMKMWSRSLNARMTEATVNWLKLGWTLGPASLIDSLSRTPNVARISPESCLLPRPPLCPCPHPLPLPLTLPPPLTRTLPLPLPLAAMLVRCFCKKVLTCGLFTVRQIKQ